MKGDSQMRLRCQEREGENSSEYKDAFQVPGTTDMSHERMK